MAYQNFAYYYDSLMDPNFYQQYLDFILKHAHFQSVLELGCGTGITAINLAKKGKIVYATDLSKEMLEIAKMNASHANVDLMLGKVDMCDFQINEKVDLILCLCDSLNYVGSRNKVKRVFKNVYDSLDNQGTFIFDVHSMYKIDHTFFKYKEEERDDDFYFLWEVNKVDQGKIHHTIQIDDFENNEHVLEHHTQTTYSIETYKQLLKEVRFKSIEIYTDFKEYDEKGDRVIFVVKKEG